MQFCCCAKFSNAKKITLFRLDPHLISRLHRQLSVPKENSFHFHSCIYWGITVNEGEEICWNRMLDKSTHCACWKRMHERCWISIKKVSFENIFCSVPPSTHPFRYIRSFEIIWTQHVWLFKHQKRAPETSGEVMFIYINSEYSVIQSNEVNSFE